MPHDFPPWKTVHHYFRIWRIDGTWERLNAALRKRLRVRLGRNPQPSAGIVDSQSAKTTGVGGEARGYDGGKKVRGRKRHLLVVALALSYPDVPSAIVILDAPVVRPAEGRAAMQRFIDQLRGASYHDYQELMRGFVSNILFIPTDDQERKERIAQQMSSVPQHVVVSAFEGIRDFDPAEAGRRLAVPALYVEANEPQPRSDMARLREMFPQIQHGKTVGSGHFCQLEVPEQVNAMIDRFLASTLPT